VDEERGRGTGMRGRRAEQVDERKEGWGGLRRRRAG